MLKLFWVKNMNIEQLYMMAFDYLNKNPYRFNDQEKLKFMQDLRVWIEGSSSTIADEVYDFLVDVGIANTQRREDEFIGYLNKKYGMIKFSRILDVGAGRMCKLSEALSKYGNAMYAIDPKIRLTPSEAVARGIRGFKK